MEAQKPLKLFASYAHKDEKYLDELRTWLRGLEREELIEWWHDREITPGWVWEEDIDKNLRNADIILLLVSPDFMASDYVYANEVSVAVDRHERGEARVIPIIVRRARWKPAPFAKLQALPKDAKPVAEWPHRDEAWDSVAGGVEKAVEELLRERHEQAEASLKDFERVLEHNPEDRGALHGKGWELKRLDRLPEAVQTFKRALELDPNDYEALIGEGWALAEDGRYQGALEAFEQALVLKPDLPGALKGKGHALIRLDAPREGLKAFEQVLKFDRDDPKALNGKGWALSKLGHNEEALEAFKRALELDPMDYWSLNSKGWALYELERYQGALEAFEQALVLKPDLPGALKGRGWAKSMLRN